MRYKLCTLILKKLYLDEITISRFDVWPCCLTSCIHSQQTCRSDAPKSSSRSTSVVSTSTTLVALSQYCDATYELSEKLRNSSISTTRGFVWPYRSFIRDKIKAHLAKVFNKRRRIVKPREVSPEVVFWKTKSVSKSPRSHSHQHTLNRTHLYTKPNSQPSSHTPAASKKYYTRTG